MESGKTKEKKITIGSSYIGTETRELIKVEPRFNRKKIFTFILFFIVAAF
jgi:hypothetical protein